MIRYINVKSKHRTELIDITDAVRQEVSKSNVKDGICYLYVPHTTAAVTINEGADPAVKRDVITTLKRLVPKDMNYAHMEGNSDAHIKSSAIKCSSFVLIENGTLFLGTWQSIYFCEFDGPRHRRLALKVVAC